MIIKEKRWLSRFVAMLCVLTMVVGVLTPASYGRAANSVNKITIGIVSGINFIDNYGLTMNEMADNNDFDTGVYKYKKVDNNIEVTPSSGTFADVVTFDIEADAEPLFAVSGATKHQLKSTGSNKWQLILVLASASSDVNITPTKQYSVTFPAENGFSFSEIKVNSRSTEKTGSVINVKSEDTVSFKVSADDFNKQTVEVTAKGTNDLKEDAGVYSFTVNNNNVTISAAAIDKKYTIEAPSPMPTGYTYTIPSGNNKVTYGQTFSFYVTPADGYKVPKGVYVLPKEMEFTSAETNKDYKLTSVGGNLYISKPITKDMKVYIDGETINSYTVNFTVGAGYTVDGIDENNKIENNIATVKHGDDLKFNISVTDNSYVKAPTVIANNKVVPIENGQYILKSVKENTIVNIAGNKQTYKIKLDSSATAGEHDNKYKVSASEETIEHGGKYTFYVEPMGGYKAPTVKCGKTKDSAQKIDPVNGTQYVITITDEITIFIEEANLKEYNITYNEGDGYSFSSKQPTVKHSNKLTFTLKIEKHYSDSKPVVSVGGKNQPAPTPSAGPGAGEKTYTYTVSDITSDQIVTVNGIQKNTYKVILTSGEGYTITTTENTDVTAENDFRFKVTSNLGYSAISVNSIHSSNGQKIEEANDGSGDYIIKNLNSDTNITVDSPSKKQYKTIITGDEHATVEAVPEYNLNDIKHGATLKFTVNSKDYYHVTRVFVNGDEKPAYNNVYTVSNVTDNIDIDVETKANTLTVTYLDEKYDNNSRTVEYSVEYVGEYGNVATDGSVTLYEPDNTDLYKFEGWLNKGEKASNIKINDKKDTELILTADWKLNVEKIKENIELTTSASWGGQEAGYTYTIKFKTAFKSKLDEEYRTNIKVTGVGTLYSNTEIPFDTNAKNDYIKKINERNGESSGELLKDIIADRKIYNFYKDYIDKDTTMLNNGDYISLRLGSNTKQIQRYGRGWVELTINGEKVILFSSNEANINEYTN